MTKRGASSTKGNYSPAVNGDNNVIAGRDNKNRVTVHWPSFFIGVLTSVIGGLIVYFLLPPCS